MVLTAWSWESPVDMAAASAPEMISAAMPTGMYLSSSSGKMVSAVPRPGMSTLPAMPMAGVKM